MVVFLHMQSGHGKSYKQWSRKDSVIFFTDNLSYLVSANMKKVIFSLKVTNYSFNFTPGFRILPICYEV